MDNEIQKKIIESKKRENIFYRWIRLNQSGFKLKNYMIANNWKNIAVYGYNNLCRCVLYELKESNINIKYIIDKKAGTLSISYPQILPNDVVCDEIDVILICLTNEEEINSIKTKFDKAYSFEELIYEL